VQRAEGAHERGELVMRVEAAGVGQHPELGVAEALALPAGDGLRPREGQAVGLDAHDGDAHRRVAAHLALEAATARHVLGPRQLGGVGGRARDEVRDPAADIEQPPLVPRREHVIGEARAVQRAPEAVARPREVVARRARVQAGVDAAEEHLQPRRDEVGDGASVRGGELGLRGARAGRAARSTRRNACPRGPRSRRSHRERG